MDRQDIIIGKIKPVCVTDKGVKLYIDQEMVKLLNGRIKQLNLENVQAFLALHPNGDIQYLLVKDGKPCQESQKVEDIGYAIESMLLTQKPERWAKKR